MRREVTLGVDENVSVEPPYVEQYGALQRILSGSLERISGMEGNSTGDVDDEEDDKIFKPRVRTAAEIGRHIQEKKNQLDSFGSSPRARIQHLSGVLEDLRTKAGTRKGKFQF